MVKDIRNFKKKVHLVEKMDILRGTLRSSNEISFEWKKFSYFGGRYRNVHRLNQQ